MLGIRIHARRIGWTGAAIALVTAGAILAGCSVHSASGTAKVQTVTVGKQAIDSGLEVDADVMASSVVPVVTKVSGDVLELVKKRGDTVQAGDILFRFDTKDALRSKEKLELTKANLQAQLDKTAQDVATNKSVYRNNIGKMELQLVDAQQGLNKLKNDYDLGLVPKMQLDKTERQVSALRLDLDTTRKQLANLENTDSLAPLRLQVEATDVSIQDVDKTLADFEVKAQASGVLTDFSPEVGMTLQQGYPAGQIQRLDPVKIHADLTESALKRVQGKKEVKFKPQGSEETWTGTVSYLADVMSPQSKSFVLELSAPNAGQKLKAGMRVKLLLGEGVKEEVPVVPASALIKEGNDNYVFVAAGEVAEKRKVTLGRTLDAMREVTSGLKEGETLIVSGQHELKDQDKIEVIR